MRSVSSYIQLDHIGSREPGMDASEGRESCRIPLPGAAASNETIPSFLFPCGLAWICCVSSLNWRESRTVEEQAPPPRRDPWRRLAPPGRGRASPGAEREDSGRATQVERGPEAAGQLLSVMIGPVKLSVIRTGPTREHCGPGDPPGGGTRSHRPSRRVIWTVQFMFWSLAAAQEAFTAAWKKRERYGCVLLPYWQKGGGSVSRNYVLTRSFLGFYKILLRQWKAQYRVITWKILG